MFIFYFGKAENCLKLKLELEYDQYFYERKKELEKVIEECGNGTMEMLSQEQYDDEMEIFFKDLKANANL